MVQGLSIIRAFQVQRQFDKEFLQLLDANGQGFFMWLSATRWLGFRLDFQCAVILLLAAILGVAAKSELSPSLVGLALTYTLQLGGMFQWAVRQTAEVENQVHKGFHVYRS